METEPQKGQDPRDALRELPQAKHRSGKPGDWTVIPEQLGTPVVTTPVFSRIGSNTDIDITIEMPQELEETGSTSQVNIEITGAFATSEADAWLAIEPTGSLVFPSQTQQAGQPFQFHLQVPNNETAPYFAYRAVCVRDSQTHAILTLICACPPQFDNPGTPKYVAGYEGKVVLQDDPESGAHQYFIWHDNVEPTGDTTPPVYKSHIQDLATLENLFRTPFVNFQLPLDVLAAITDGSALVSGDAIQKDDQDAMYLVHGGKKAKIVDATTLSYCRFVAPQGPYELASTADGRNIDYGQWTAQ